VVAVAIAVVVTLPAWGGRSIAGKDVMFQLVRADFGLSHLLFHGRLDGWFPRFFLGHQEFLVYGPGLTWTVGVVRVLTLGTLSTAGAMKVVSLASFAGFPLAVAFVARSYGLRRNAAGFAALLSLLVSTPYGLGLQGLFQSGLIAHQVGAIFWALALGSFLHIPRDRRARWIVLGAASLGALALTHDISLGTLAIVYATSIACLALRSRISWSGVQRVAGAAALGAALIGFWVIPFLAHRDLQGNFTTWATPNLGTRLHDIIAGGVLFPPFVGIVVVAAWLWGWRGLRTGGPYALAVLVAPAAFLVTSHTLVALWPHNVVIAQLANRGLGFAGVLATFPLAQLLGDATARCIARARNAELVTVVAVAGVAALVVLALSPWFGIPAQIDDPKPQTRAAARVLARVVPDGARFAFDNDHVGINVDVPAEAHRLGVIHPDTWLARASGRNLLDGEGIESSVVKRGIKVPDEVDATSPVHFADELAALGVTDYVATHADIAARLSASPRFHVVWRGAPITILGVTSRAGQPAPASQLSTTQPATARLTDAGPEHLAIRYDAAATTTAHLAVAWSSKWHAAVDGRAVTLHRSPSTDAPADNVLTLTLPAGAHTLRLDYRSDGWDHLGIAVSLATLVGVFVGLGVHMSRKAGRLRQR
jgi:hypothetical protein